MANEYGTEEVFRVYIVQSTGQSGRFETTYGLVHVRNFDTFDEAENWIKNEGERHADYTILHLYRNR